jgi:hypothetical protein
MPSCDGCLPTGEWIPIFIAVKEEAWSSRVTLLFPEDQMEEAVTLAPALPIIMEAKYGP